MKNPLFANIEKNIVSWNSSFSEVHVYGLDDSGLIPGMDRIFSVITSILVLG
jgi:hypothetical protein